MVERNPQKNAETDRRRILQAIGSSALVGTGLIGSVGLGTADEDDWETESLPQNKEAQLRGDVLSTGAFKAIRDTTRDRGFKPEMDKISGLVIKHKEEEIEQQALRIPCTSDNSEEKKAAAVIYGIVGENKTQARCLSQKEEEPVVVDSAVTSSSENANSDSIDVVTRYYLSKELGDKNA